jgi:hypothetical protein
MTIGPPNRQLISNPTHTDWVFISWLGYLDFVRGALI